MLSNKKNTILIIFIVLTFFSMSLFADKAYFDLSEKKIKIKADFNGKEVIIFGLADKNYDTVIILKGPKKNATISFKERVFGIWIKTKKFEYDNIPSIFFIASSSPINNILDEKTIRTMGLNFKNFDYTTLDNSINNAKLYEKSLYNWNNNFIRKQKNNNFYKKYELQIVDEKMFKTRVFFPPNTIPGTYKINIFQVKNKKIHKQDTKTIVVEKTGIGSTIYKFAQTNPALYGILCIIFAIITGVVAATAFRRL